MPVTITREAASQIVEAVKEVCSRDINYISPTGIIMASTNPARIGTWHSIAMQAAKEQRTIEIAPGEEGEGTQPGINLPLFHEGEVICVIGITGSPEEVRRYAFLASSMTKLLIREQVQGDSIRTRQERREYAVRALTGGEMGNPEYLRECLRQLQVSENCRMYAARIVLASRVSLGNVSMIDKRITDLFRSLGITLYRFRYPSEYILLFYEADGRNCRKKLREFAGECAPLLTIGCGRAQEESALRQSYREAVIASEAALGKGIAYAEYDSLDIEILLAGVDAGQRKMFRGKILKGLGEEELELLKTYFRNDCSLTGTAWETHLHKNTLQYRLNRIRDLCGYNPREFRDAAVLYLALAAKPAGEEELV